MWAPTTRFHEGDWREPTASERELLAVLLAVNFKGREAIQEQVRTARVRTVDAEGSIAFDVSHPVRASVSHRVAIEAEADDRDGVAVHMLLHVVDGRVSELEFYKDDSSPILELPPPTRWRTIQLHE